MEILTTLVSLILLGGLVVSPFIILYRLNNKRNAKYKFIAFLSFGIIVTATITLTLAWWTEISNQILLSHYGYDFDAMNNAERFVRVTSEDIERVKSLETSMMGIGWPIKAWITYAFFSPYLLFVYLIVWVVKKAQRKNN